MFFHLLLACWCLSVEATPIRVSEVRCPQHPVSTWTTTTSAPTAQILYTADNILLHLSDDHQVIMSTDTGRTWDSVPTLLNQPVRRIAVGPDRKHVIYLGAGEGNKMWISRNGGSVIASRITTPVHLVGVKFHPTESSWLIALSRPGCRQESVCSQDLWWSPDGGVTWAMLRKYVEDAYWHEGSAGVKQNIVVRERKDKSGNMYWTRGQVDLVKSDTFFRGEPVTLVQNIVASLAMGNHIFIAKVDPDRGYQLWSSEDMGENFRRVSFSEDLDENSYSILDLSEGSAFILVSHGHNWGNVYAGDSFDEDFTLALEKTAKSAPGARPSGTDFRPMRGLEGVYIANVWSKVTDNQQVGSLAQTLISYDKGGEWKPLAVPANMKGRGDRLNLLGPAEEAGGFYSRAQAIGLMFASGHVGSTLSTNPADHGLYVTRDAGWSWAFAANGSHTYEIGNKGAFVVAAKDEEPTKSFQYSLTEGTTWFDCPLFKDGNQLPFDVDNIISDPTLGTRHFVLYGEGDDGKGYISVLDFTDVHERECAADDYELWEPSDRDGDECLLGRRVIYKRRKPEAACFLPADFDTKGSFVKNCPCDYENYICEYCWVRDGKKCVKSSDPQCADSPTFKNVTCTPGLSYSQTQGYRRVPGDTCDVNLPSSINLLPKNISCPGPSAIGSAGGLVVLVIIVVLVAVVGTSWYFAGTNENFRSTLANCIPVKFLPDRRDNVPDAHYSQLGGAPESFADEPDAIDSDARELNLGESTDSDS